MTSVINTVDTSHEDLIHDASLDYYGLKLATCSSDHSVKIFHVTNRGRDFDLIEDLNLHKGPVWQVAWSHPMFGTYLASCSYDRRVIVWKEMSNNKWTASYEYSGHTSSVNSVAWAPSEYGLIFACGSSDGTISVVSLNGKGNWTARKIDNAHQTGCNAVSWSPAFSQDDSSSLAGTNLSAKRLVSGGCDNQAKIWREEADGEWVLEHTLTGHTDWVRDVAWSPNVMHSRTNIASCAQNGKVLIWSCELSDQSSGPPALTIWKSNVLHDFSSIVWHVSWSLTSNMLAVSSGDNKVTIWKEDHYGKYICINDNNVANVAGTVTIAPTNTDKTAIKS